MLFQNLDQRNVAAELAEALQLVKEQAVGSG